MRKIDVYAFIAQQRPNVETAKTEPLTGETEVSHFRRFSSDLPTQKLATETLEQAQELNRVDWQVDGEQLSSEIYPDGRYLLHFYIEADPVVTCQRCMKPFRYPLTAESTVEVVRAENQFEEVSDSGEVVLDEYEKVLANPYLDILELIEDELILALPFMPSHEDCEEGQALLDEYAAPAEESPFAVLEKLKKD
jgi:uncharacterized protein